MSTDAPHAEIVRRPQNTLSIMSDDEINRSWRLAEALAASKLFPDAREAAQAFAKMLLGHDLGLSPTQALTGIHIVEGKPVLAATTLASFVKRLPGYDYAVDEHTDQTCSIAFCHGDEELGISTFTMEDAKRAGLVKPKSGWEKYPRNMLFARAMSNGVKWYVPEASFGIPVYTEGDEFAIRTDLTAETGDGEPLGIELPVKVEQAIERATALGHSGLSDRAAIEVQLAHRSPEVASKWAKEAQEELDRFEREAQAIDDENPVADAEVVGDTGAELPS